MERECYITVHGSQPLEYRHDPFLGECLTLYNKVPVVLASVKVPGGGQVFFCCGLQPALTYLFLHLS